MFFHVLDTLFVLGFFFSICIFIFFLNLTFFSFFFFLNYISAFFKLCHTVPSVRVFIHVFLLLQSFLLCSQCSCKYELQKTSTSLGPEIQSELLQGAQAVAWLLGAARSFSPRFIWLLSCVRGRGRLGRRGRC